jgi:MtN3 and saliva related transmembrane protein
MTVTAPSQVPHWATGIGFAAATLTTISLVPQLARIWRRRSADDISTVMFGMFFVGVLLWFIYGVLLASWPMIAANAVTLVFSAAILVLKIHFAGIHRRTSSGVAANQSADVKMRN